MLRLNRAPGPKLALFAGMGLETAMLAADLGVFDALDEAPATLTELAPHLMLTRRGRRRWSRFSRRQGT